MIAPGLAWDWLRRELDNWGDCGLQADFWWRDDDAVESTLQLDRLLELVDQYRLPLALAVILAAMHESLHEVLNSRHQVSILQHGYTHCSHALPGQRKLELGGDYPLEQAREDLARGQQVLQSEFGARFVKVMVPPWNRIGANILEILPELEFTGISAMRVRRAASPTSGLLQVNTHLDPVNWRHQRGFIGLYPAIAIMVQHLIARRCGYRDMGEPTGILSHHLAQNDAVWRFLGALAELIDAHPACCWRGADHIWHSAAG